MVTSAAVRAYYAGRMASRAEAIPRQRTGTRKKKAKASGGTGWKLWLPLAAGLVATWFAVRYAEVVPLLGPGGLFRLRLIAPLAMLVHQPQLGIPETTADSIAQALMYVQFPLYGLILGLTWRAAGFLRAALVLLLVHGLAFAAVMILSQL
jgi:hypothetical protein